MLDSTRRKKQLNLAFLALTLLLVLYLALTSNGWRISGVFFWVGFLGSLGVFLLQCHVSGDAGGRFLQLEMVLLVSIHSFMFALLSPFSSLGYDENFTVGSASHILEDSWPIEPGESPQTVRLVSQWPLQSILGATIHQVAYLDWESTLRFLPPSIYWLVGVSLYLLATKSRAFAWGDAAMLGVVGPLSFGILITDKFMNVGLGTPLLFIIMYLLGRQSGPRDLRFTALIALMVVAIAVAHHLSAFYLLFVCFFYFGYFKLSRKANAIKAHGSRILDVIVVPYFRVSVYILSLTTMVIVIYWTYVGTSVITLLYNALVGVSAVESLQVSSTFLARTDLVISLVVDATIALVLAVTILVVIRRLKDGKADVIRSAFLLSALLAAFVLYSSRLKGPQLEFSRSMGLAFVFLVMSFLCVRSHSRKPYRKLVLVCTILLLVFCGNQVYRMDITTGIIEPWQAPVYSNSGYVWGGFMRMQDLEAVMWFPQHETVIGDQIIYSLGEGWKNLTVVPIPDVFKGNFTARENIDWLFIRDVNRDFVFAAYQTAEYFGVDEATFRAVEYYPIVFDNGGVRILSFNA